MNIVAPLLSLQKDIHANAVRHGWWETVPSFPTSIALMHSELSEALEADRLGDPPDDKIPDFTGREAELADVIIRILDTAEGLGLDVIGAIVAKHEMNKTRSYKHGGKEY